MTDGLSYQKDKDIIIYFLNQCQKIGLRIFGIGLGIYPYKGKELFQNFLYSINPENIF